MKQIDGGILEIDDIIVFVAGAIVGGVIYDGVKAVYQNGVPTPNANGYTGCKR